MGPNVIKSPSIQASGERLDGLREVPFGTSRAEVSSANAGLGSTSSRKTPVGSGELCIKAERDQLPPKQPIEETPELGEKEIGQDQSESRIQPSVGVDELLGRIIEYVEENTLSVAPAGSLVLFNMERFADCILGNPEKQQQQAIFEVAAKVAARVAEEVIRNHNKQSTQTQASSTLDLMRYAPPRR